MVMINIKKLTKYYDQICGVKDLSLNINSGQIFGFIGPNGAGKSTTIRCIMNYINKNSGEIIIDNDKINFGDYKYKENIGYLPGEVYLYNDMTVMETINYAASFYSSNCKVKIKELVKLFKVDTKKKINELSLGNKKKVGIIIALMNNPKILILDEPTSGLDPIMQNVLFDLLLKEKEKGTTIFFSTHNLNEVKKICDFVGIIKNSELIKLESVNNLTKNNLLTITLFGEGAKALQLDGSMVIKEMKKDKIVFMYKGDINNLIIKLSKIKVENILIEEPFIEEIFLHYYE